MFECYRINFKLSVDITDQSGRLHNAVPWMGYGSPECPSINPSKKSEGWHGSRSVGEARAEVLYISSRIKPKGNALPSIS